MKTVSFETLLILNRPIMLTQTKPIFLKKNFQIARKFS